MTQSIMQHHNNEMKTLQEATEVSISIYNEIDEYNMPEDNRIKHKALGQVLRSLVEILENERARLDNTQSAA
jgi:hypothetical protein